MATQEYVMMHVPVTELEITSIGMPGIEFWKTCDEYLRTGGKPITMWLKVRSKASDCIFKRFFELVDVVEIADDRTVRFTVHVKNPDGTVRPLYGCVKATVGGEGKLTLA